MSHIPNSAMPHAGGNDDASGNKGGKGGNKKKSGESSVSKAAGQIADKARENPKTAIAAGAAVVGAIAAAAIPLVRGRGKSEGSGAKRKTTGGATKKSGTTKSSSKSD
jgi:hypothetical protein